MKSLIEQKLKETRIENSSEEFKNSYKVKSLDTILTQLANRENRYVFYCPDIVMVNSLAKMIYELAYETYELGHEVVILHEINGFKCKWLVDNPAYSHLKELNVDYIIKQKSGKSKKTKSQYAFQPADTLIVPDQFQEMLDNLVDVKILQKVVLVSSYTGLSALNPGVTYKTLGVEKMIFVDDVVKANYESLFTLNSTLLNFPIDKEVFTGREEKDVLPLIAISNVGNSDFVQQVVNVFYNKYPHLRIFNFRLLDRDSIDNYVTNLKVSALLMVLDKNLGNSQMINEALSMGCPVATFKRPELSEELSENVTFGDSAFDLADNLAVFCNAWLNNRTKVITDSILSIKDYSVLTYENFSNEVSTLFDELRENRVKFFASVKESINVNK